MGSKPKWSEGVGLFAASALFIKGVWRHAPSELFVGVGYAIGLGIYALGLAATTWSRAGLSTVSILFGLIVAVGVWFLFRRWSALFPVAWDGAKLPLIVGASLSMVGVLAFFAAWASPAMEVVSPGPSSAAAAMAWEGVHLDVGVVFGAIFAPLCAGFCGWASTITGDRARAWAASAASFIPSACAGVPAKTRAFFFKVAEPSDEDWSRMERKRLQKAAKMAARSRGSSPRL